MPEGATGPMFKGGEEYGGGGGGSEAAVATPRNPTSNSGRSTTADPSPILSPPSAVLSRLRSVASHHASALSSVSTISAASTRVGIGTTNAAVFSPSQSTRRRTTGVSALATVSHRRSKCPQPPLPDSSTSHLGGGSAVPVHESCVIELDLNPPERVAPHRIVPGLLSDGNNGNGSSGGGAAAAACALEDGESPQSHAARKAIAALSALCDEADELAILADRRILPPLALFGCDLKRMDGGKGQGQGQQVMAVVDEMNEEAMNVRDGELLRRVGKFVPALQETFNFTLRCRRLVRNMVCQIGGAAAESATATATAGAVLGPEVRLIPLAEAIAKLLRILIAIDETVAGNGCLNEGWELFKSVMRDRAIQLQTDGKRDEQLESFERLLVQLDFTLLSCRSFVTAVEQNFDPGRHFRVEESPRRDDSSKGAAAAAAEAFTLYGEVKALVTALYDRCCKRVGTAEEGDEANLAVGIYGVYCLYRRILPSHLVPDGRLHRALWMELPSRRPVIPLFAYASFFPREFLLRYAPYEGLRGCTPSADPIELRADTVNHVLAESALLPAAVDTLRSESLRWLAAADSDLASYPSSVSGSSVSAKKEEPAITVEKTVAKIVRGIRLAHRASIMLRNYLISHSTLELPIQPEHLPSLMTLCEIVKSLEKLLRVRRRASVVSVQRAAVKMSAASIYRLFESLRLATDHYNASIDHEANSDSNHIARVTACLSSLEGILKGSSTFSLARRETIAIAMACCASAGHDVHFDPSAQASNLLEELSLLSDIDNVLRRSCDLSFLYFHKEIFIDFARLFYRKCGGIQSFQLVCSAFSDADDEVLLLSPPEHRDGIQSAQDYRDFLLGAMQEEIIGPICQVIDAELRLATLARSPRQKKQNNPKLDRAAKVRQFLDMPTLRICGTNVSIKESVQKYLESIFYVMSAISLQDNSTYSEMKAIALQFGLNLTDDCLPPGSADCGADLLHMLRTLGDVVQTYNYDMNQQVLIEKRPANGTKCLLTVDSHRLASSLQQHGLGIIDHAINISYTLLWEKFESMSQFLVHHDQLVSLFAKETRWYRENRAECGGAYPFGRAAEFSEEIASLGDTAADASLLDQLRILLTQIGNTLAFVRMIWSAEVSCSSGSTTLPWANRKADIPCKTSHTDVDKAVSDLDNVLKQQNGQFGRKSSLQLVSDEFKRDMKEIDYVHLQNFEIVIPALCLNWLEAILRGKEMMHKQNLTSDVYFADDGFALGIAFVLSVCNHDSSFDALNWFAAIKRKQTVDEKALQDTKAAQDEKDRIAQANQKGTMFSFTRAAKKENVEDASDDDEERAALTVSWRMFESRKREMKSLFCTLHCSRALLNK